MNKNIIFLIFIVALVPISHVMSANADKGQLWIPEKMIKGQLIYGMIVLDTPSNVSQLIILGTSNSDIANVQKSVSIAANQNHGIFEIIPKSQGDITISAVYEGKYLTADATIYSDTKKPSVLKLIVPGENVKTEKIQAAVYSLDGNGSPIPVEQNTRIKISSSDNLQTPRDVMIPFEKDHVFFPVTVNGNGFVSVSSTGFESSKIDIQKTLQQVDVDFGVGPQIAHENSLVYFYIQLQKDDKPYKPPYVVDAFLTSSDESIVSFSKDGKVNYDENKIFSVSLVDGFAKGIAYTKNSGSSKILVNVPAFGFASSDVIVGKAVINADISDNNQSAQKVIENQNNTSIEVTRFEKSQENEPTDLLMWIMPSITDKNAFAVIGAFDVTIEKEIQLEQLDDQTQQTTLYDQFTITPTLLDEQIITVSSSGNVKHESTYELRQNYIIPGSAIEIPLEAHGNGVHSVFVSAANLDAASSEFEIVPPYHEEYNFQITPLPFLAGNDKDVAMVSVVDGAQSIVDVSTISEENLNLFVSSQNISTDAQKVQMYKNTYIVNADDTYEKDLLSVSSEQIPPTTIEIIPSGIASSSEILASSIVHVGENFPYVVYNIDSNGVPLEENDSFDFSASNEIDFVDEYFLKPVIPTNNATVAVITDNGISSLSIKVFENDLSFESEMDTTSARVNDDVLLRIISDVAGIDYTIESPFPHRQLDESSFVITPDKELTADVTIIGTKDGYSAYSQTIPLDAKKIVTVLTHATTNDGKRLVIPYEINSLENTGSFVTPFTHDLKTASSVIEFPDRHTTPVGHGYAFQSMQVNDEMYHSPILETELDEDLDIILNYQRQVYIEIDGTDGTGVYEYGQTVHVDAPDIPKVWYFVKDAFDHWEGIDETDSSITINATQDMQIAAIYREDHSTWMVIVLATSVGMVLFGLYKKNESVRWIINEYVEKILSMIPSKKIEARK